MLQRLPLPCVIGAPIVFGRSPFILVRLVVPTTQLLEVHAEVVEISQPHLVPAAAANSVVGQWTPHTTLARSVQPRQLAQALTLKRVTREIRGEFVGLRRWNGNQRVEHLIT